MFDISKFPTGWSCVLYRPPAGRCVLLAQQPWSAGQIRPCRPDHLLPPQPRTRGAGCHRRALGERVLCPGQPAVHSRGTTRIWPATHPVTHLFQPVAGLPPDGCTGQGGGVGQLGAGAPGRHHLQLHAGLPEGEAVPGPPGGADHLHRQCDRRRDLLYIRREVQLYTAGDSVLCHGWVGLTVYFVCVYSVWLMLTLRWLGKRLAKLWWVFPRRAVQFGWKMWERVRCVCVLLPLSGEFARFLSVILLHWGHIQLWFFIISLSFRWCYPQCCGFNNKLYYSGYQIWGAAQHTSESERTLEFNMKPHTNRFIHVWNLHFRSHFRGVTLRWFDTLFFKDVMLEWVLWTWQVRPEKAKKVLCVFYASI